MSGHRRYPVACPLCGRERLLRRCDIREGRPCKACHNRRIAPLGGQATLRKYGLKTLIQHARRYRLAHPSDLEQIVSGALDDLGVAYEREALIEAGDDTFLIDFLIGDLALEVFGDFPHRDRAAHDRTRARALREAGYRVVILPEAPVRNGIRATLKALNLNGENL